MSGPWSLVCARALPFAGALTLPQGIMGSTTCCYRTHCFCCIRSAKFYPMPNTALLPSHSSTNTAHRFWRQRAEARPQVRASSQITCTALRIPWEEGGEGFASARGRRGTYAVPSLDPNRAREARGRQPTPNLLLQRIIPCTNNHRFLLKSSRWLPAMGEAFASIPLSLPTLS